MHNDSTTGPLVGVISGTIANIIGFDTIQSLLTALACGFMGAAGQLLFKRIVHIYHKRNEKAD